MMQGVVLLPLQTTGLDATTPEVITTTDKNDRIHSISKETLNVEKPEISTQVLSRVPARPTVIGAIPRATRWRTV